MLLAGCGGSSAPTTVDGALPGPDGAALSSEQAAANDALDLGGPITRLPACGPPPPAGPAAPVEGVELPPGAVVTAVEPGDPLVTVRGYVDLTPVLVRRYYQERAGLSVYNVEDEVVESEVLVGNGRKRTYVKALATCATGSSLLAVVGPEGAAGVPAPVGSPPGS